MHLRRKFFMAHPSPRLDPQSKTKRTSQTSHALEADSTGNPCSWIKALRQHQEAGQWGTDINSRSRERTNEIWQTAKIKYKMRVCLCVCSVAQSCLTLCDPMDSSPPGSSVRGIFQAGILEQVAIFSSRGSAWPRNRTQVSCVSCTGKWILYHCDAWEAIKWGWRPFQQFQGGARKTLPCYGFTAVVRFGKPEVKVLQSGNGG